MRELLESEWIKLRSVRSTWWALLAAAVLSVGVAAIFSHVTAAGWDRYPAVQRAGFDALSASFNGFSLAQLAMATLGVLAISSEYGTGLIRTTFTAAPRRPAVLAAKALVVGLLAVVAGELIAAGSFVTAQVLLRPTHTTLGLTDPAALRGVAGAGLYLGVVALLGLGLGGLVRHTAGALAAVVALLFLIAQVVYALPDPWRYRLARLMPPEAAQQISSRYLNPHLLGRPGSLLVLLGWMVAALVAAGLAMRRDP